MITGLHLLLTYACNLKCDHCFLYSGPGAKGTFSLAQLKAIFDEAAAAGTIDTIYFEGGEPFLYYPVMLEGIREARTRNFKVGIVTNGYWANSVEDAKVWLKPLYDLGICDISISDDSLHYGDDPQSPAKHARQAAQELGMPVFAICKQKPEVKQVKDAEGKPGAPEISGNSKFRGRAVEKFTLGLPTKPSSQLTKCPWEDLRNPQRVHIDPYGNVQVCQGISIGNCWKQPLSIILHSYDPDRHPICGPLLKGGPDQLRTNYALDRNASFIDECHSCYCARMDLLGRFPEELTPLQVYGK